ncbi:hypothetical protein [Rickettsia sibirica]|uniref:hypothetical protein n=1 Tax=Rickettsia sibirica TaxID=35793 RepID=UPI0003097D0D|nr:hypothetical protein [Rickettsia sibirica]
MDTWQSNQISRPLTKVAEEIQKTNPKLVKNLVTKNISNRVHALNLKDQEQTKIVNNLIAKTDYLLSNNLNPLESVRSEINKTLALLILSTNKIVILKNPGYKKVYKK